MRWILCVALGVGCGEPAATCVDADGDGFLDAAFGGSDCDDSNPDVRPDALDRGDEWSVGAMSDGGNVTPALAPDGGVAVLVRSYADEGASMHAKVGWWDGGGFDLEPAPLSDPGLDWKPDVFVDAGGVLHALYANAGYSSNVPAEVVYSTYAAGEWNSESLHQFSWSGNVSAGMALDEDGEPWVAMTIGALTSVRRLGSPDDAAIRLQLSWFDNLYVGTNATLVITRAQGERVRVWTHADGSWSDDEVPAIRAVTTWHDDTLYTLGNSTDGALSLWTGVGESMTHEVVGADVSEQHGLAVGADGSVHVVWENDQATVRYVARSPQGAWSEPHILGHASLAYMGQLLRIVVTPLGELHVWHATGESYVDWQRLHHYKVVGDGVDNDCDGNAG